MTDIDLQPPDDHSRRLWSSVGDLVSILPAEWVLIGGLMVQLYALEAGIDDVRATMDDVLGQARPPGALASAKRSSATAHWIVDVLARTHAVGHRRTRRHAGAVAVGVSERAPRRAHIRSASTHPARSNSDQGPFAGDPPRPGVAA